MSKFAAGQAVRIVQITDIDAEHDDPNRITEVTAETNLEEFGMVAGVTGETVGRIIEPAINDYYDLTVEFNGETYAFMQADLTAVDNVVYTITGTLAPHKHSGKPVFLHEAGTDRSFDTGMAGNASEVKVTTTSPGVANTLESVYAKVFDKVMVTVAAA